MPRKYEAGDLGPERSGWSVIMSVTTTAASATYQPDDCGLAGPMVPRPDHGQELQIQAGVQLKEGSLVHGVPGLAQRRNFNGTVVMTDKRRVARSAQAAKDPRGLDRVRARSGLTGQRHEAVRSGSACGHRRPRRPTDRACRPDVAGGATTGAGSRRNLAAFIRCALAATGLAAIANGVALSSQSPVRE